MKARDLLAGLDPLDVERLFEPEHDDTEPIFATHTGGRPNRQRPETPSPSWVNNDR